MRTLEIAVLSGASLDEWIAAYEDPAPPSGQEQNQDPPAETTETEGDSTSETTEAESDGTSTHIENIAPAEPEPPSRQQQLQMCEEEFREMCADIQTSRSPIEVRSYMETYHEYRDQITRLSTGPSEYLNCVITGDLMVDLVMDTTSGHTFERANIERWIQTCHQTMIW